MCLNGLQWMFPPGLRSSSIGQSFTPVRSMFMSLNSSKIYCMVEA